MEIHRHKTCHSNAFIYDGREDKERSKREQSHNNKQSYDKMALNNNTQFTETYNANLLNGIEQIQVQTGNTSFSLIPYYAWDNREAGRMKVWLDYIN